MEGVIPIRLFTFNRLDIAPPPADAFEDLMGYSGNLRFVGFSYRGQTLCIEDGQTNEIGDWRPWSIWYRSLGIAVFKHYCFGYRGRDPEHILILDRKSRALYAAPMETALEVLRQQIPPLPATTLMGAPARGHEAPKDLTDLLTSTMSATDCQIYQAKKRDGLKKLEQWLNR